jgi:methylated-DNA-[protein]-cysteine S-methyltransferase
MDAPSATARMTSPVGLIELGADETQLHWVRILAGPGSEQDPGEHAILAEATAQLRDWFAGRRRDFGVPLRPMSTQRGNALRAAIAAIPYGATLTYGSLASRIGSAPRAVGQACMRNPFPIVIPCHRIVSTNGPEHYSGGDGPRTKAWLIAFEQGKSYDYGSDRLL